MRVRRSIWNKIKLVLPAVFLLLAGTGLRAANGIQLGVDLYGQVLWMEYDAALGQAPYKFGESAPKAFREYVETQTDLMMLVNSLHAQKTSIGMNDWLYFVTLHKAAMVIFPSPKQGPARTMLEWMVMEKEGYKVKLYYDEKRPYLYVRSDETIYEVPIVDYEGERYVEPAFVMGQREHQSNAMYLFPSDGEGRSFSFALKTLPALKGGERSQSLTFTYGGQTYTVDLKTDKALLGFLRAYPQLSITSYPEMQLSESVYGALLPAIKEWTKGKSVDESVRLLMSFTRQAFEYKTDREAYNVSNLVFGPELTLFAPFSDCEDRAILFSYLCREALGLESILIAYPDHMNVAVALPQNYGYQVEYNGRQYTVCEPTGPADVLPPGELPDELQDLAFEVYDGRNEQAGK